jgi:beta-glucosidase
MNKQGFGKDFVWGVATSALQTEGSLTSEGRGESVWDQKCLEAGPGDDSYQKIQEDIALLKAFGVKAYRFSVSWSRIMPEGIGKTNAKGCQYYKNLVVALKENGIEPYVTLFHWDYPVSLEKRGGWLSEESPYWFLEYAKVVGTLLNGLVSHYF